MGPDEISFFAGVGQAIGFPTSTLTDRAQVQQAKFKSDEFFKNKTTSIKREYVRAVRDGDVEAMAEAREDWANMNASRKAHGYKVQALSELIKAPGEQRKREASAVAGVIPAGKRDAGALRVLEELNE